MFDGVTVSLMWSVMLPGCTASASGRSKEMRCSWWSCCVPSTNQAVHRVPGVSRNQVSGNVKVTHPAVVLMDEAAMRSDVRQR